MTRILYGLCGVGLGHAIRSKTLLDHLTKKHEIMIISSQHVSSYLKHYYKNVHTIEGFELIFKNNTIATSSTLLKNASKVNPTTLDTLELTKRKIDTFNPELVISDWETFSMYIAKWKKIPLLSIDNQHYLLYGNYSSPPHTTLDYLKAHAVLKLFGRKANHYLITLLPDMKLKTHHSITPIPPILRPEILTTHPIRGTHILVYQSTNTYKKLINILKRIDEHFIIYGFNTKKKDENLTFKKFDDKTGFITDLAHAKAVISNGGFTLISEALYLKKPLLVVPIQKHFEQILNASYIKEHKLGESYKDLTEKNIKHFLSQIKQKNYSTIKKWNNQKTLTAVDEAIKHLTKKLKNKKQALNITSSQDPQSSSPLNQ